MMLTGVIRKGDGPGWAASCDAIGVYTQGKTRADARVMLADAVEMLVNRQGFKAFVCEIGKLGVDDFEVTIDSEQPELLAATLLRQQREYHQLTLAEVAKRLGSSINSYAAYEQGTRAPSLAKFRVLLAAVAPELVFCVRAKAKAAATPKSAR